MARRSGARLAGSLALLALVATPSVRAQETPPPEAQPALELIRPAASEACGLAMLVAVLGPPASPVIEVCGAVGTPEHTYECPLDQDGRDALAQVASTAGAPFAAEPRPLAAGVEQVVVIEDALPPPANGQGLATTVATTITCARPSGVLPPPPIEEQDEAAAAVPGDDLDFAPLPDSGSFVPVPDLSAFAGPVLGGTGAPVVTPAAPLLSSAVNGPSVTRAPRAGWILFALPLLFLAGGGVAVHLTTRPRPTP